jgi:hypothetical protein
MIAIILYLRTMLFKRILTGLLMMLILFADSGQMIYAHTCFKSNQTSLSLFAADNCCGKKKSERTCCIKKASEQQKNCTIGKMSCCSVSAKYVKQSFPNSEEKQTRNTVLEPLLFEEKLFSVYLNNPISNSLFHSPQLLLRCKEDIRFTQSFRI